MSRDFLGKLVLKHPSSLNYGSFLLFEILFEVLLVRTGEGIIIGRAEWESLFKASARLFCV